VADSYGPWICWRGGRGPNHWYGLTGDCVARRKKTCKEWNGTGKVFDVRSSQLFTLSAKSLVKQPLKSGKPIIEFVHKLLITATVSTKNAEETR
jgi:hypothetical protein